MNQKSYGEQIQDRLNRLNLTIYGASQLLAAETDDSVKTCHQRITQLIRRDPKSLTDFKEIVETLGGTIKIEWD